MPCPAERQDEVDQGRLLETVSGIQLGIGLAVLAASAVMIGVAVGQSGEGEEESLTLRLGPGGVSLSGVF